VRSFPGKGGQLSEKSTAAFWEKIGSDFFIMELR